MARVYVICFLVLSLTLNLTGCGGGSVLTSTAQASGPSLPDAGPDSQSCDASGDGMACTFVHHVKDGAGNELFYCQGETHYFPLTHTISWHLEIGVSALISDPNLSGCNIPMPARTTLLNMKGNLSLNPWTGNHTSIATWVYAIDAGHKAVLYPGKLDTDKGISLAVPFEGTSGEPLVFPNGHAADSFLVWFDFDLKDGIPATISASGASDVE
jgi:hypothetical protein